MVEATTGRLRIKADMGVTNTLSDDEFYDQVIETCYYIKHLLVDHCGPHATDALIIQNNDGRNLKDRHYAIFTKDGIGIVNAIEFVSPIQQQIQSLISYIGSRVDSLSHDGTTTAMLFFTDMVSQCLSRIKNATVDQRQQNRRQSRLELIEALQTLVTAFEATVITVDDFATKFDLTKIDAIRYIAYQQAMLSSKEDRELSSAIVDVVETLPAELYGLFSISQSGIETDKRFTVIHDDFNFVLNALVDIDAMNSKMGTEYLAESCDLILSEDDLISGNPVMDLIFTHLKIADLGQRECDLVLITKSIDPNILVRIKQINNKNKHKIIVFTVSVAAPYSSKLTMLSAIMNTAGVCSLADYLMDPSIPYVVHDAKIHYRNKRVYISNLYPKDGSQYHPCFTDPTRFPSYTRFVTDIREALDTFTSGRLRFESHADQARYQDYMEIYRRMICSDVRHLQISGKTHDVLADRDLLQDAFGAVLSSLENGFVLDGYLKLFFASHIGSNTTSRCDIRKTLYNILFAVHKIDTITENPTDTEDLVFNQKIKQVLEIGSDRRYLFYAVDDQPKELIVVYPCYRTEDSWFSNSIFSNDAFDDTSQAVRDRRIVIQPADAYRELFRRCQDLLPKIMNTHRVIIPGTINSEKASP